MIRKIRDLAFGIYHKLPYEMGSSIFEYEWDVLVILDACRPDALEQFTDSFDWMSEIDTIYSVGSNSQQWIERTFNSSTDTDLGSVGYVTGNPFSRDCISISLGHLDEVWRYAWDDSLGALPARPITDRAINIGRSQELDRLIIHYMQPHFPSIPTSLDNGVQTSNWGDQRMEIWESIEKGELERSEAWEAYIDNLYYVLEEVDLLLENIEAERIAISADHGEAFGEWGLYGHGPQPAPVLRRVPFLITSGEDCRTHTPSQYQVVDQDTSRDEQLKALGYR